MSSATISSSGLQALGRIPRLFEWDDDAQDVLSPDKDVWLSRYSREATRGSQAHFPRQKRDALAAAQLRTVAKGS